MNNVAPGEKQRMKLEDQFIQRVRDAIEVSHRIGYHPTGFETMLANRAGDAIRLAKDLVTAGNAQSGLRRLKQHGRLDLAIESIMLEPKFQQLFESKYLEAANWQLKQLEI